MNSKLNKKIIQIIFGIFFSTFIFYLIVNNKLLSHAIIEFISIVIAANMFIIAIRGSYISKNNFFTFLGISYGFVAFFDLLHFLSYPDISIITNVDLRLTTQLWLLSRSIEAFALLLSFRFLDKKLNIVKIIVSYFIFSCIGTLIVVKFRLFSGFHLNGFGILTVKLITEIIIISIIIKAIILLWSKKKKFHSYNTKFLLLAMLMTIVAELFFINELNNIDLIHTLGHVFKLISIYLIYLALIRKLTEEVNKLSQAVEQSPSTVVITDLNGEIEYVNPKFTDITGYKYKEVRGKNPKILKSGLHSKIFYEDLWETITSGKSWRDEFYNRKKNGEYYWEDASISPIRDNEGDINHFLKVGEEITDRKEYEKELEEKSEQLKRANKKITKDLNKAKSLHEQFLPSDFPEIKDIQFATYYQPAKKLGGDFYNIIEINNLLIFYIVDVTGHGLDGAMLNIFIRGAIDSFLLSQAPIKTDVSPSEIVKFIVQEFQKEDFPADYFICLEVGVLNLQTMELKISNSGIQIPPLIISKTGEINEISCIDLPISAVIGLDKYYFSDKVIQLDPGDTVFLTTDGLIEESKDGQQYGTDKLEEVLKSNYYLSPELILKEVMNDFSDFSGSKQGKDDITIFSLYYQLNNLVNKSWSLNSTLEQFYVIKKEIANILEEHRINSDLKEGILIAIQELVTNAIEHGNEFFKEKEVFINLVITDCYCKVIIKDQGNGFDWKSAIKHEELNLEGGVERGRGIIIARMISDYLTYDEQGTEVTFVKKLQSNKDK